MTADHHDRIAARIAEIEAEWVNSCGVCLGSKATIERDGVKIADIPCDRCVNGTPTDIAALLDLTRAALLVRDQLAGQTELQCCSTCDAALALDAALNRFAGLSTTKEVSP